MRSGQRGQNMWRNAPGVLESGTVKVQLEARHNRNTRFADPTTINSMANLSRARVRLQSHPEGQSHRQQLLVLDVVDPCGVLGPRPKPCEIGQIPRTTPQPAKS